MLFEAIYSPRAQWLLDRVPPDDHVKLQECIVALEHNPYPDVAGMTALVIPYQRLYQRAFRCGAWAIAFHVEDDILVVIDEIGRSWPPVDPGLRESE